MDKTLRKSIVYTETFTDNNKNIATLRGTINTDKVGAYTVNCTVFDKTLYEENKTEIEQEQESFSVKVREEANSEDATDTTVVSEATTTSTKTKSTKTTKK